MIVINFKNYKKGRKVLELVKDIEKINLNIICCLPMLNLLGSLNKTRLKLFSQNVDYCTSNRHTGFVCMRDLKSEGVYGSILNHSEHKTDLNTIKKILSQSKGFKLILCASTLVEVKKFKKLKPWAICYEDPKLISTKKSIVDFEPKKIEYFVKMLENENIISLCGAGIHRASDYEKSISLGCDGILVSSAVMSSSNPKKIIREFSRVEKWLKN